MLQQGVAHEGTMAERKSGASGGTSRKAGGRTGSRRPASRTDEDRARDRAINRAIKRAGKEPGPIIVRLGNSGPAKSEWKSVAPRKVVKQEEPSASSAMADALLKAGLKTDPDQRGSEKLESSARTARSLNRKKSDTKVGKTARKEPRKPANKKRKIARGPKTVQRTKGKKAATREEKFIAALRKRDLGRVLDPSPGDLRWQQKQEEIAGLIHRIEYATFGELATEWKKHVGLVGYIDETGHNSERLDIYSGLIAAIEREWGRRAKLVFNSEEYFDWPTTRATKGSGRMKDVDWAAKGVLSYLGYHVGETAELQERERRAILRRTFRMVLPPFERHEYILSWGKPSSPTRLKKMADSLASFARSAKLRSTVNLKTAIDEWEGDLAMLHDEFYVGKFGFGWPRV